MLLYLLYSLAGTPQLDFTLHNRRKRHVPKAPLLLLLFGLSLAGKLYAQDSEPVIFEDIDTDHDGAISRDEAKVREDLISNFDSIDTNKNGTLSVDEYTTYHNKGRLVPEEVEIPEPGSAPLKK